jgi:hypothetical protein
MRASPPSWRRRAGRCSAAADCSAGEILWLFLRNTQVADAGCICLVSALDSGALPALRQLDLDGSPASDASRTAVREALERAAGAAAAAREALELALTLLALALLALALGLPLLAQLALLLPALLLREKGAAWRSVIKLAIAIAVLEVVVASLLLLRLVLKEFSSGGTGSRARG